MGQALRSAPAGHRAAFSYERRRPEETTLYQVVQEQFETFLAQVGAKTGTSLPEFVKDEFEAYLECGILAHGFLRVRCADCAHEKLVAFSCKRRGFCPSCGARRMAETAAHLVDHVIPGVPVRQWVLSFPIPLRILFAAHPELLAPVLLFYLAPLWTVLFSRALLGEVLNANGALVILLSFAGAMVMLYQPGGIPLPENPAEWIGLSAGMAFALSNVLARKAREHNAQTKALAVFAGVMVLSVPAAMAKEPVATALGASASMLALLALVGIAVFAINVVVQYGLARTSANRAIVIFLFELVVAAIAAYLLAGEMMEIREWIGGGLIVVASLFSGKLEKTQAPSPRKRGTIYF